jgi:RNA polymerase sigma-70 factor (ECF subfamily)
MLSDFEQRRRLQLALEALPSEQREAFLLRVESGLGLEEIAAVTGAGHETVKSRLRYAFAKLREKLAE